MSNSFRASILRQSGNINCEGPEHLILEISVRNCSKILLAVVYRPPHCGFSDFFDVFSDLSVNYKHSIIFGDFNADLCSSTFDSEHIRSFVRASNFFLVPYTTTHHTRTASTLLDLCLIDESDKLVDYVQREVCFLSAHDLIAITYDVRIERIPERTIRVRDFRAFNLENFLDELASLNWSELYSAASVDAKVDIFNNLLLTCYDQHAPFRVIRPKHLPAPWLTEDIKSRMRERDRARRVWMRSRTDANYLTFRRLRNLVQVEVRRAKSEFFHEEFQDLNEPNEIWRKLRKFGLLKSKARTENLAFTSEELVDHFTCNVTSNTDCIQAIYLGETAYDDSKFYWSNIEPLDIVRTIGKSKSDAMGVDGLPRSLVVRALPSILLALTHIFNFCFSHGVFPEVWKSAIVCPVPKVRSPAVLNDFRPISILCATSKVLERIAADQIMRYLEEHNLLDPFQSAYRKDFSTQTALIRVLDEVRLAADKRRITIAVFFDFSKAFDNVCHDILIDKARNLGFACSTL
ncbi:uncharacterized protein LOC112459171, partial [Temnothorax curvispinosus]|uniref:Uncharacterized protein LOC112459171 n=1 Tax=Temnothorax curvispinosus TaxID=300111 RepID=A0A6J1Q9K7_9HYME